MRNVADDPRGGAAQAEHAAERLERRLPSIAAQRQTRAGKVDELVQGELDWIVMKALEKDRTRRYETANGLARDLERYLHDEPVEACPPSAAYRLRKFARRNRVAFTSAVLVLIAIVLGAVVSTAQAIRATRAERLAEALWWKSKPDRKRWCVRPKRPMPNCRGQRGSRKGKSDRPRSTSARPGRPSTSISHSSARANSSMCLGCSPCEEQLEAAL